MSWYVVVVPPQKEELARQVLSNLGYHSRVPMGHKLVRRRRGARKRERVKFPLLKRYLFANFPDGPPYHILNDCPVFQRVLAYPTSSGQNNPVALADHVIERLTREADQADASGEYRALQEGQRAEITDGPLSGQSVTIKKIVGEMAQVDALWGSKTSIPLQLLDPG